MVLGNLGLIDDDSHVSNSFFPAHLNDTIVILSLVYLAGALAACIRAWLFTLAGQRLVARIRKQVSMPTTIIM